MHETLSTDSRMVEGRQTEIQNESKLFHFSRKVLSIPFASWLWAFRVSNFRALKSARRLVVRAHDVADQPHTMTDSLNSCVWVEFNAHLKCLHYFKNEMRAKYEKQTNSTKEYLRWRCFELFHRYSLATFIYLGCLVWKFNETHCNPCNDFSFFIKSYKH